MAACRVLCESYGVQNEPGCGCESCDVYRETFVYSFTQLRLRDFFPLQLPSYKFLTLDSATANGTFKQALNAHRAGHLMTRPSPHLTVRRFEKSWILTFTFRRRKRRKLSPMNSNLNQVNVVHSYTPYLSQIHFKIILTRVLSQFTRSQFVWRFPTKTSKFLMCIYIYIKNSVSIQFFKEFNLNSIFKEFNLNSIFKDFNFKSILQRIPFYFSSSKN